MHISNDFPSFVSLGQRNRTLGPISTHPVILNKAALHARQTNTEPPIRTPLPPPPPPQSSRFATSSATFPGEGHGENWHPQDPYWQDPQYEKLWSDQWRSDSYMLLNKTSGIGMAIGHRPLPYGHHLSSPCTSSLHMPREPPRNDYQGLQQSASFHSRDLHFREFQTWLASLQGVQRVRFNSFLSYLAPCPGKIINAEIFCVTLIRCYSVTFALILSSDF
jgi:hypothetical protein